MCFGFTDEVPSTVKELDLMTRDAIMNCAGTLNSLICTAKEYIKIFG